MTRRQWRPGAQRHRERRDRHRGDEDRLPAVDAIDWPEGFCRRDIGWRALG
jgi:phosphoribosylamine-glycine ligase